MTTFIKAVHSHLPANFDEMTLQEQTDYKEKQELAFQSARDIRQEINELTWSKDKARCKLLGC